MRRAAVVAASVARRAVLQMYADKSGLVTAALAVGVKQRGNATAAGRNAGARFSRRALAAPRRAAPQQALNISLFARTTAAARNTAAESSILAGIRGIEPWTRLSTGWVDPWVGLAWVLYSGSSKTCFE